MGRHDAGEAATPGEGPRPGPPTRAERQWAFRRAVLRKSYRRRQARERGVDSVWSWLGMAGLVGWSVTVPALAGLALGSLLDRLFGTDIVFAVLFLLVGTAAGLATAWYWIRKETQVGGPR